MTKTEFEQTCHILFKDRYGKEYNPEEVYWEVKESLNIYFSKYGVWEYNVELNPDFFISVGENYIVNLRREFTIIYRNGKIDTYNSVFIPYEQHSNH